MVRTKEKEAASKMGHEVSREQLEIAAYYHWINRGCPVNDDLTDWLEAEKEAGHDIGQAAPNN